MKQKNIFSTACHTLTAVRTSLTAIVMLLTVAVDIARADNWPEYVSDVMLIGGTESSTSSLKDEYRAEGWTVIDYNLNEGCQSGSDFIFLLYKTASLNSTNGGYITNFYISDYEDVATLPENVNFSYKNYSLCPYVGDSKFMASKGDLNRGAGGKSAYIHLYYTKANFDDKRAVTAITFDASSENALPWNGDGTTAADLNKGGGSSSDYIYMHLTTATKTNRPKTDPVMKSGLVYNGQAQQLIMTAATIESGEMCYLVGTSGTFTTNVSSITAKDAGTHTVSYYASENQYGDASATHSQAVSIGKSANNGVTVTIAPAIDMGATPQPTLSGTNLSTGTPTFLYATAQNGSYSATVPTASGSYWVKATIAADNNCDAFTTQAVNFRIMPWQGSGTAASPYLIKTTDDLRQLATDVNGGNRYNGTYFQLTNDLDFQPTSAWDNLTSTEDNYTAIGDISLGYTHYFYGHFDGNGYTISGIRINKGNTGGQGLFSIIGGGAEVSNLTLTNTRIIGGNNTGGIVGHNYGGKVSNCHVTATVAIHAANSANNACQSHGGIVGSNTKEQNTVATVSGCTSAAKLTTAEGIACQDFGGIAGYSACTLTGNMAIGANVAECNGSRHGAIVGRNANGTLTNNYYRNCNVRGCNGSDIDGAMLLCTLTLGDGISATTTATPVVVATSSYYVAGTTFTLSGGLDALADPAPGHRKGYAATAGTVSYATATASFTLTLQGDATVSATNRFLIDWADEATGSDADNAYKIYNAEQLDLVAQRVNNSSTWAVFGSKYYCLMSDIGYDRTQENNYTAIGTGSYPFRGHFDGDSHAVRYININKPSQDYQGLFGCIGQGGEVRNVVVDNASVTGSNHVGCIAGCNNGGTLANNYYDDCQIGTATIPFGTPVPKGCDGADISDNDGAMEVFNLIFYSSFITIETSPTVTVSGLNYYKKGLLITLSGQPANAPVNEYYGYTLNAVPIDGNCFTLTTRVNLNFSSTPIQLTEVVLASGITASPSPLKTDGTHRYYMPATTITLTGGMPSTQAPEGYIYPYTVNGEIIFGNTFKVPSPAESSSVTVGVSSTPILVSNTFITAGHWNDGENWNGGEVPRAGSDVFICADVTVPAGYLADAGKVTVLNNATITVDDGGQLKLTNSGVTVSMKKRVQGQADSGSQSCFIASPVTASVDASNVENMTGEGCTLLTLARKTDPDVENGESSAPSGDTGLWWKASTTLENGKGYKYARTSDAAPLTFTGTVRSTVHPVSVPLSSDYGGWNLVGNPFPCSAYIVCLGPVYRMNADGDGYVETESHVLAPMEAVLISAAEGEQEVAFIPDFNPVNPLLVLKDRADNTAAIAAANDGRPHDVLLQGRTLYKDGRWNTLCLPFSILSHAPTFIGTPLEGAEIRELNRKASDGFTNDAFQLHLTEVSSQEAVVPYTELQAGKPYLLRWVNTEASVSPEDMVTVHPLFQNVVISSSQPATVTTGSNRESDTGTAETPEEAAFGSVFFVGTYNAVPFTPDLYDTPFMEEGSDVGACRAYFKICRLKEKMDDRGIAFRGLTTTTDGDVYISDIAELPVEAPDVVTLYPQYVQRGDVNGDGKVTPADAIMILYHYFGVKQSGFIWRAADLNGDSAISPADAIETLYRYFSASSNSNVRTVPLSTPDDCPRPE
jgi:hypothetical protein